MTVIELIEKLKEVPPELPVVVFDHDTGEYEATQVRVNVWKFSSWQRQDGESSQENAVIIT